MFLFQHSPNNEVKLHIINYLCCNSSFHGKCISDIIEADFMKEFFAQFSKSLITIFSNQMNDDLHKCILGIEDGYVAVPGVVEKILDLLLTDINQISGQKYHFDIDKLCMLLAQTFTAICTSENSFNSKLMEKAFLKLFYLSCQDNICNMLIDKTIEIINQAWQKGITSGKIVMDDKCLSNCAKIIQECIQIMYHLQPSEPENDFMLNIDDLCNFIAKFIKFSHLYVVKSEEDKCKPLQKMINVLLKIEDNAVIRLYDTANFIEAIKYDFIPFNGFGDNSYKFKEFTLLWKRVLINISVYDSILFHYIDNPDSIIEHDNEIVDALISYIKIAAAANSVLNAPIEVSCRYIYNI